MRELRLTPHLPLPRIAPYPCHRPRTCPPPEGTVTGSAVEPRRQWVSCDHDTRSLEERSSGVNPEKTTKMARELENLSYED